MSLFLSCFLNMKVTIVKFSILLPPFFFERTLILAVVQNLKHCPVRGDQLAGSCNSPGKKLWGLKSGTFKGMNEVWILETFSS